MRPAVRLALQNATKPDNIVTVFAGQDTEATERARSYFTGYPPSSPSIAILRDGKLVYMMPRNQIETRVRLRHRRRSESRFRSALRGSRS